MSADATSGHEFVRFSVDERGNSHERLEHLRRIVDALAAEKSKLASGQVEPDTDDELRSWCNLLPEAAMATFAKTPGAEAWLPPSGLLEPGWDELSMFSAILGAETRLCGIFATEGGTAELRFVALAWPYGGITSLIRLVETFGFDVLSYDEGSMPEVTRAEHLARRGGGGEPA